MDSTRCISSFVEHILQSSRRTRTVEFGPEVVKIPKKFVEIRYRISYCTMFWHARKRRNSNVKTTSLLWSGRFTNAL
jgi:hypothetical protein